MATIYIDFDSGNDSNPGTIGSPKLTPAAYTAATRAAGDIGIVKFGTSTTLSSNITLTSDGNADNPIILKADFGNAFGNHSTLTPTATLTVCSKTVTFSADISSDISAGDMLYFGSDDPEEYSYIVNTVDSTTQVTLYLPYKGDESGSGVTCVNMGAPPKITGGSYLLEISSDDNWEIHGLDIETTNSNGAIYINGYNTYIKNCKLSGTGYSIQALSYYVNIDQCVLITTGSYNTYCRTNSELIINNCYITGGTYGIYHGNGASQLFIYDTEIASTNGFYVANYSNIINIRNVTFSGAGDEIYQIGQGDNTYRSRLFSEDHDGTLGDNRFYSDAITNDSDDPTWKRDTSKTDPDGGTNAILFNPVSGNYIYASSFHHRCLDVWGDEIPIYLESGTAVTITINFASYSTSEWSGATNASDIYLELEYLAGSSGAHRKKKRSTGTLDFTTDTNWGKTLSVTVTPGQSGLAYLRCKYAKAYEASYQNRFYVYPKPSFS